MLLAIRSLLFLVVVPGTVLGYVPYLILRAGRHRPVGLDAATVVGGFLIAVGLVLLVWCVAGFLIEGRGTLAPFDPPRRLVTGRLYRRVRNPMYLAVVTALCGEALMFGSFALLVYAGSAALFYHLLVVVYEEPSLHRRFGRPYDDYRRQVPRWLPRTRRTLRGR